ncbi:eukaryotic translation initiation factor 3 subunit F-like [Stylophora pistillata]|uniref:eukaryotic translation initiation factor 3 subunit F-like n=1 Tax=Stylophora pistillata TaxID=50429 RepID=UPI000C040F87|nr:eukaryotic translation initiation factor 3 subunit F-like [Stylophora pistillata]
MALSETVRARKVFVHPVVLFSIVDGFERRSEDAKRVIGTLLGTVDKTSVEIRSSFGVPHNESEDEVAVELEYAKSMFDLHKKSHPNDEIVGWYATGSDVTVHSLLIHEYYSREANIPVHVTVDTTLKGSRMGIRAYQRINFVVNWLQRTKHAAKQSISPQTDMQHVNSASERLLEMLGTVVAYVDDVLVSVLGLCFCTLTMLARPYKHFRFINSKQNHHKSCFKDVQSTFDLFVCSSLFYSMLTHYFSFLFQDLLMIVYLSGLCKAQISLGEKLATVL